MGLISWACADPQRWFHEPLPGTFFLLTWSFMFPGMPRTSSFLPPAAAPVADVLTGIIGDGPRDGDGDDAVDAEVDDADASPTSAWSPPPDMADIFMSQVGLSPDT